MTSEAVPRTVGSVVGGSVGGSDAGGLDVGGPDHEAVDVAASIGVGTTGGQRGRHTARWIAGIVLVVIAGMVVLLATRPPAAATEVWTPLLGKTAPNIVGTTVTGQRFDLNSYRGRWVFVNFFATWCPPCQQEEPDLVTFAYQHRAPGDAALVSVVYNDTPANARAFDASSGATWPAVIDPGGQISIHYGVSGPPETFLISPTGVVVAHLDSSVTAGDLDQQLASARAAGL
jgi:cytochrome c biogenesis protein CcmG, thiol:disulfide interchange protein DsbE